MDDYKPDESLFARAIPQHGFSGDVPCSPLPACSASEKRKLSELPIEPFAECYRCMTEAAEALNQAQEIPDFQAIGVRCREALLAFSNAAQVAMPWPSGETKPDKAANFKAWVDHICAVSMAGESR